MKSMKSLLENMKHLSDGTGFKTSIKLCDILKKDTKISNTLEKEAKNKITRKLKLQINLDDNIVTHIKHMIDHIVNFVDMFKTNTDIDSLERQFLRRFKYYNTAWNELCSDMINIFRPIDECTNFNLCINVKKEIINKLHNIILALFVFDPEADDKYNFTESDTYTICEKINRWLVDIRINSVKIIHGFSVIDNLNVIHCDTQKKLNKVIGLNYGNIPIDQVEFYKNKINDLIISKSDIIESIKNMIFSVNKIIDFYYFMSPDLSPNMNNYFEIYFQ